MGGLYSVFRTGPRGPRPPLLIALREVVELRTLLKFGATNAFDVDANSAAATAVFVETIVLRLVGAAAATTTIVKNTTSWR